MKKVFCSIIAILAVMPFQLEAKWYQHSFNTMGTKAHVEFWLPKKNIIQGTPQQLVAEVTTEMNRLDQALSPYIETSELSLLNQKAGHQPITVSSELFGLLKKANKISTLSEGAFDITYASIGYQYNYRQGIRPSLNEIDSALPAINYNSIKFDAKNSTVSFDSDKVKIDLGGIAKGYAIARCLNILKSFGIKHALMNAGGDTALLGDRMGRPWLVGIKHPRTASKNAVHIPLDNEVISTSGDYERYFIEDGIRYHHILNPKTGDSAREVVSASVIGSDATIVDALSTTVFVLGNRKGMALIDSLNGYEAIIIDNNERLHFSKGLQQ